MICLCITHIILSLKHTHTYTHTHTHTTTVGTVYKHLSNSLYVWTWVYSRCAVEYTHLVPYPLLLTPKHDTPTHTFLPLVPNSDKTTQQHPKTAELCGIKENFGGFVALQGSAGYFQGYFTTKRLLCKSGVRNILISARFCPLLFAYAPECWWSCFITGQCYFQG